MNKHIDKAECEGTKVSALTSLWTGEVQNGTACLSAQQNTRFKTGGVCNHIGHQYSSFFFKMFLSIYFTQLNISHLARRCYFCL